MAVREPASLPEDAAARQRMRAEAPPPHYWRRWTGDAATMPAAAKTPADRQSLMAEHMKAMQEGMDMMKGMKSMGGMSGMQGMGAPGAVTPDMTQRHQMMEMRMDMMQNMMEMMMQRMPQSPSSTGAQ